MITHFQFKSLFENKDMPGWHFSFYFKKQKFTGIYHQNGDIEWTSEEPSDEHIHQLKEQIHELMLFHVYDK
ncbi:YheE family protein [Bacillus sp. ISL-37]|uniref:YheE family protein n=1 Tax=Bacillus sp. ISL-37 TaxID=2819123 RepID=UPI001BED1636|nr:YheE family protein [Bacillus sp. ISL-37]MBT2685805.1 YheE family protein [Bacillus sp. ISL-37]